ncbi:MAG TPA: methyltransferase domain-containing protein [Herpetosiphonaceae bacterium]|nr:methyltransferase domain-containing protein [Herpetosiphonaceae bacterium]
MNPFLTWMLQRWRALPRRTRTALSAVAAGIAIRVGVQLAIQVAPRITPPALSFLLHSPPRRRYRMQARSWAPLRLRPGLRVLEIGSGTGAWTGILAGGVAPDGMVCSIELQRAMLKQHVSSIAHAGVTNMHLHQADALQLPFAADSFDRAVMIAVLPMLPDKQRALSEVRRVLKRDGLLLVSEDLIEPEYVPPSITRRWGRRAGFEHVATHRTLWFYSVVFRPA